MGFLGKFTGQSERQAEGRPQVQQAFEAGQQQTEKKERLDSFASPTYKTPQMTAATASFSPPANRSYDGLEASGHSFSAAEMPAATRAPGAPSFAPREVGVQVSSPGARRYSGFDSNTGLQDRADDFQISGDAMVEDRLSGLLGSNSDYLKRAQSKAATYANRRGLLNSSIASGAGTAAAIDAALPIAQQDANTHAQSQLSKQNFVQSQALSDQEAVNTSRLSAQDATQRSGELDQGFENTSALNNQQAQQQANLSAQDATQQAGLQRNQALMEQMLNLDKANQQSALSAQDASQRSGLQAQGANEALRAAEQSFIQQLGLNEQNYDIQRLLSDQNYRQQIGISEQDFQEAQQMAAQEFAFQESLQKMDQDSRAQLLDMQQQYAMLLQQSQSASNRFQDLAQQVALINTSPDMNATQKTAAIEQLYELHNRSLQTQSEIMKAAGLSGIDVGETAGGEVKNSIPTSPDDERLSFDPTMFDKGNIPALDEEVSRLKELANQLPANTMTGFKAREALLMAEVRKLEMDFVTNSSARAQRHINNVKYQKLGELQRLRAQWGQDESQQAATPQSAGENKRIDLSNLLMGVFG